jgi:hypothetical protein
MNNTLERACQEVVVTYFETVLWHLPVRTVENHKMPWLGYLVSS